MMSLLKKRLIIFQGVLFLFFLSFPALAQLDPEDLATLQLGTLQPLVEVIRPLIVKASLLVGGIFGLYIILIALRVHYERKNMKLLQHIRYDFDQLNKHHGIPSSQEQKSVFHRVIIDKLFPSHAQQKHPAAKIKQK